MALPDRQREVQGALDVQSLEPNALPREDIPTLQILADQLAVAVQNARMLRDTQEALFAARKATGEISQKGWQAMIKNFGASGYIGLAHGEVVRTTERLMITPSKRFTETIYSAITTSPFNIPCYRTIVNNRHS
jgi:hypothetical protein